MGRVLIEAVKNGWTVDLIRGSSFGECEPPEKATERYVYTEFADLVDALRDRLGAPNWVKATCALCGRSHGSGEVWEGESLATFWGPLMCPWCREKMREKTSKNEQKDT